MPCKVVATEIVSPAVNFSDVLLVPEFSYFTYKVFGSVPSAASTPITFAVTPEVPPVNLKPIKSFSVTPTAAESVNEVSFTEYKINYNQSRQVLP